MTVSIFLYIYYAFLVVWAFFNLALIYHLLRFGMKNLMTFLSLAAYVFAVYLIFSTTYVLASGIDWQKPIIEMSEGSGAAMWDK